MKKFLSIIMALCLIIPSLEITKASAAAVQSEDIVINNITGTSLIEGTESQLTIEYARKDTSINKENLILIIDTSSHISGDTQYQLKNFDTNMTTQFSLFELKCDKEGTYPAIFKIISLSTKETLAQYATTITVSAKQEDVPQNTNSGILSITGCSTDFKSVTSGKEFSLTYKFKNIGMEDAYNTTATFNYSSDTFLPITYNTIENIGIIRQGTTQTKSFKIKTNPDIKTGYYPLEMTYTSTDKSGEVSTSGNYTTYIYVVNPNAPSDAGDTKTTPRVILSSYSLDVENVMAGTPFTFNFSLKNTSKQLDVGNMLITVSSADGIFTPVEGSSSFYTERLATVATSNYSIKLSTKSSAETKSYPITIAIQYEDGSGNPYSASEDVNLIVTQPIRLDVIGLQMPEESYGFNPINVNFRYYNKGKSSLTNFSICMEGDFTFIDGDQYIGALSASSYDEFSGMIMPIGTGEQNGVLVLKFEDSTGTEQRVETPFTINIMEEDFSGGDMTMPVDPMFDDTMGEITGWDEFGNPIYADADVSGGLTWWVILIICVAGVAVVIAVTIIIVKKVKKNKAASDDDDYDDEE